MRACLVSDRVEVFGNECADRERGLDLLVVRAAARVEALDFDLDLVMGSSEVMRRHPPHHLSPARAKPRQGKTPKRAFAASSHHSNAPIKPISQSNLSKIVALLTAIMACLPVCLLLCSLLSEATTLLNAASLINRIARQS
jgi:hypothetical protein